MQPQLANSTSYLAASPQANLYIIKLISEKLKKKLNDAAVL